MLKRTRVVEKPDSQRFTSRMASADFFDASLPVSSSEIEAEISTGPGAGLDAAHLSTSSVTPADARPARTCAGAS